LLIFTRGDVVPPAEELVPDSVIQEPIGAHSEKPVYVYDMLEALYGHLPKVEIFARSGRPGWQSFGNQLPTEAPADALPEPTGDDQPVESHEEVKARARGVGKPKPAGKPRLVKNTKRRQAAAAPA
jgi:hypothetical protein